MATRKVAYKFGEPTVWLDGGSRVGVFVSLTQLQLEGFEGVSSVVQHGPDHFASMTDGRYDPKDVMDEIARFAERMESLT